MICDRLGGHLCQADTACKISGHAHRNGTTTSEVITAEMAADPTTQKVTESTTLGVTQSMLATRAHTHQPTVRLSAPHRHAPLHQIYKPRETARRQSRCLTQWWSSCGQTCSATCGAGSIERWDTCVESLSCLRFCFCQTLSDFVHFYLTHCDTIYIGCRADVADGISEHFPRGQGEGRACCEGQTGGCSVCGS